LVAGFHLIYGCGQNFGGMGLMGFPLNRITEHEEEKKERRKK
jgi:hypothetical protein